MCGRASLSKTEKELEKRFSATFYTKDLHQLPFPNYNIAPTHLHPVITNTDQLHFSIFQWGLLPPWSKDPKMGSKMINARIETLLEKPAFKQAIHNQRCIIPLDGFYEWKKNGKLKTPYRIHLKEDKLFSVAGLWEKWTSEKGNQIYSFTIITQEANELMAAIHNRMPAILLAEHEKHWLDINLSATEALQLIQPYPSEKLEAYTVSQRIGNVNANDSQLIEPFDNKSGTQGLLF